MSTTRFFPRNFSLALASASLAASFGSPAAAIVVDSFTTNQATVSSAGAGSSVTGGADILGGDRNLFAQISNHPGGTGPVTAGVAAGVLTVTVTPTTPDSRGFANVVWDNDAVVGNINATGTGLAADLTAGNQTAFRVVLNTAPAGTEAILDVYTDAGNWSRGAFRVNTAVASATSFYLSYGTDFVAKAGTGVNFANVNAIHLRIGGNESATNIAVDMIDTVAPAVVATKRDLDLANSPIATPQLAGTTFKYRVTITNSGGQAANVDLNDIITDDNLQMDAASVRAQPVAIRDQYSTAGNVDKSVAAAQGLLANDLDPDTNGGSPPDLTVTTTGPFATSAGGVVNINSDGSFTYAPATGFGPGVDRFTYTVQDSEGATASSEAIVSVGRRIWFVDDAHGGAQTGTRNDPFVTVTAANLAGAGGVGDLDGAGDILFFFSGSHSLPALPLEGAQEVIGQGTSLVLDGETIVAAGSHPVLANATGSLITVATNNTIRGVHFGAAAAGSYRLAGTSFGTLTISDSDFLNVAGGAINLVTGTLSATVANLRSNAPTVHGVILDAVGGSLTVSNATTVTSSVDDSVEIRNAPAASAYSFGTGTLSTNGATNALVLDTNNATTSTTFGSLAITTSNGAGVLASAGGTLNVGGTGNSVNATGGPAISLTNTSVGSGVTFATLTSAGSTSTGVNLDTVTGPVIANGGSITTPAGNAFDLNAGTGIVTYTGAISKTSGTGRLIEVTSRSVNSTFSGALTASTGTGINVANNTGGTVLFSNATKNISTGANPAVTLATNTGTTINFTGGGLNIDTTSGAGFAASGGAAAITVEGTLNTIDSTTGTALSVADSTIGGAGLTFQSIASNGAPRGISLTNTGNNAGLTVSGTGANDSGGLITNSTQDGIFLNGTRSISLTQMRITNSGQSHIDATSVNGLTLSNTDTDTSTAAGFLGSTVTNLSITGGTFHRGGAGGEPTCNIHGFDITNLRGTNSVTGVTVTRSNTIQFRVLNNTASTAAPAAPTDVLTFSGVTFNNHTGPCSGDHISASSDTGGNFRLNTTGTSGENLFNSSGSAVQAAASGSGTIHASLTAIDASNTTTGVALAAAATGNIRFNVFDNRTSNGTGFSGTGASAMIVTCTTSGLCEGALNNNSVNHTAGTAVNAVQVVIEGNGTGRVSVTNNVVSGNYQRGIHAQSRAGTGSLSLHVTSNNMTMTDAGGLQGMNFEVGASGGGTTNSMCLNLANNSSTTAGGNQAYRLVHRTGYTYQLQNLAQASTTNPTDVENWVTTTKSNTGTPVGVSIGSTAFTTTPSCPTATLP